MAVNDTDGLCPPFSSRPQARRSTRPTTFNQGFAYRDVVGPADAGTSVLAYLVHRYRHSSSEVWRQRIAAGEVRVGGTAVDAGDVLRRGASLVWTRPPWAEPDVPLHFSVVGQDRDLLAVNKPRGLPTLPNGGFLTHTLLHLVRGEWPEATPMHRLGRGTSGLVLFARSREARGVVATAWREGRVARIYRALVQGAPKEDMLTVDHPIGRVPHPRLGLVHAAAADGRPARTHLRVVARHAGMTLMEVRIETGRPHQIRIHAASAGHPLVGDPLYVAGGALASDPGLPGDGGYFLHAHRLTLGHPVTGRQVTFEAPLPAELRHASR